MTNKKFKIISYIMFFLILILSIKVFAETEEELKARAADIDTQIEGTNTEIAGIQTEMTETLETINRLNIQIKEQEDEINDANEEIEGMQEELDSRKSELDIAQKEYNKQKAILDERLIAIYESKDITFLDILVGSSDITDFLSKYYMLERLAEYDNELIETMKVYSDALRIKTNSYEEKYNEVKNKKDFLEAKQGATEVLLSDKENLTEQLDGRERELNALLEQFEQDKKDIEEQLKEIARQNAIKASLNPSQSGYISPLLGKTKGDITTGYYGYSGHTGVDFAIPLGTEVMAVKDGTVVISTAIKNSNGRYRSYGEYVVVDHHDGTMTLYAHGTPNSRRVQVGDEVKQGDILMLSRNNTEIQQDRICILKLELMAV